MVGRRHGLGLATLSEERRAREGKDGQMKGGFFCCRGMGESHRETGRDGSSRVKLLGQKSKRCPTSKRKKLRKRRDAAIYMDPFATTRIELLTIMI